MNFKSLQLAAAFVAFTSGGSWLNAQDVTVTSFGWVETKDAPDELPTFKKIPRIEFPAELRAAADIGYVVKNVTLDEKGRWLGGAEASTQPVLARVVEGSVSGWKFTPGRRAGKGVNTATTVAFIFNPASAAKNLADATPRLLEVDLVELPWPEGVKPTERIEDQVVFADVSVDENGVVTAVNSGMPGPVARQFEIAAKNWRFAPARKKGQPVAAEVRAPFIVFRRHPQVPGEGKQVQPRVTFQARPVYPHAMRANGMKGEVLVDFVVDQEGRVRNAFVVKSLNPSFNDSAVDAVQRWRFEPGRIGERPVNTHMQVPIIFDLDGGGSGPFEERRGKPDLSKLPEAFRYDTPPRPVGTARPVYPYALLRDGKAGRADVGYVVGLDGRVTQIIPGEGTAPEFIRALAAAIEQFTHEPALKGGRPSLAVRRFSQEFNRSTDWGLVDDDDLDLLRREQKKPESIASQRDLDAKLVPKSRRPPVFPPSAPAGMKKGEALIEFLIDEEGRARLPRIISATDEAFGYAAMQSIASWRFEPPKRGGRAVATRAQIPITFNNEDRVVPESKESK
ncbi:MAG: TonB family protein [Undibacterium sp.]|nr:TonB family protein [Opitutaceae bacterium]